MNEVVRTRFAPSPTGYLHIGGARTALFNYLVARNLGGRFILRIEDTDQTRNIAEADQKLLEDLRWLGLAWDEGPEVGGNHGPYHQSQRLETYKEHARRLLESGQAYYAFEMREELDAMRAEALKNGLHGFRYPRPKHFPSEADAQRARDEGRPVAVRFKMPRRDFVVPDQILGEVTIGADELSDFVIVKDDGWPTYHFAVVIDDAAMKITHVLRGQEHLMNTPNHMALQEALGYPSPKYAHLPIILNTNGSKMSKREKDKAARTAVKERLAATPPLDREELLKWSGLTSDEEFDRWLCKKQIAGPVDYERIAGELGAWLPEIEIHDFRRSGYLPEVLINFIALLGWSAGDDREKYSLHDLVRAFSVERIGKTNAKFDREKLLHFNTTALAEADAQRCLAGLKDYLSVNPNSPLADQDDATLSRVLELCAGYRTYRDVEFKAGTLFVPDDQLKYDPDAVQKVLLKNNAAGLDVLRDLRGMLQQVSEWTGTALEALLREYGERHALGLGKVAQPVRVAVAGSTVSPSIFETLELLGRETTRRRIDRVLVQVAASKGGGV